MEAARVAALRGHEVTIYDKSARLGGLLPIAAVVKDHEQESLVGLIRYYKGQFAKLGVNVKLGREVDAALVGKVRPDVLIIATGGKNAIPRIPGLDNPKVIDSAALHRKLKLALRLFGPKLLGRLTKVYMPVGKNVVVIGGGVQGCQLAEFLVKRGRSVTIVDTAQGPRRGASLSDAGPAAQLVQREGWSGPGRSLVREDHRRRGLEITTAEGERRTLGGGQHHRGPAAGA